MHKKVQELVQGIPQQPHTFPAILLPTSHLALRSSTTTMLFSRNLFAALLAITAVNAQPLRESDLLVNVKYCKPDGVHCGNVTVNLFACRPFADGYQGQINSFEFDREGYYCLFYE